jgi:putative ATP-dependent endonuclease of OLD family
LFISKIGLKNFRGFGNNRIEIPFSKGINTLIGENNTGKTSIIDAIRICFSLGKYGREVYFSLSDFHVDRFGIRADEAVIDFYFNELSAPVIEIVDPHNITEGELHVRFFTIKEQNGGERIKYIIWGGVDDSNIITSDVFDRFQLLYLPALRDSERELKPNRNSLLSSLLKTSFKDAAEQQDLLNVLLKANQTLSEKDPIRRIQRLINQNLTDIEQEILNQRISIGLSEPNLETIGQSLFSLIQSTHITFQDTSDQYKLLNSIIPPSIWDLVTENNKEIISIDLGKLSRIDRNTYNLVLENQVMLSGPTFQISQNGLGLNNILYMASALGDIENKTAYDMRIILIEEPEAHLHPQLQNIIYQFFQNSQSSLQILFTTHSPTLASKTILANTNLLVRKSERLENISFSQTSLFRFNTNDEQERHKEQRQLQKFLDVTKAQLFFGKGVIFVEGISECLLLPIFSTILGLPLIKFGVEVVNLNGVSFSAFVDLLCLAEDRKKLTLPISLITDDDRCTERRQNYYINEDYDFDTEDVSSIVNKLANGTPSARVKNLESICKDTHLGYFPSEKTLEYNLVKNENNQEVYLEAIRSVFPKVGKDLTAILAQKSDPLEKATRIWLFVKNRDKYKSEISMAFCQILEVNKVPFIVPCNIERAIKNVTCDHI